MHNSRLIRAATFLAFGLLLVNAIRSGCDHDEVEHLHAAWLVAQGFRPFVDFLETHHPAVFYVFAPLAHALSGSPRALVFAARAVDLCLLALALLAFRAIAARLAGDGRARWAPLVLLGCFFFARNSMEVRNDAWMSVLCVVALWLWTAYLREGGSARAAFAGVALGCAIVFSQKAVAFAGLVALGTALALWRDRAAWVRAARGAAAVISCAALPLGAAAFAVQRAGYWKELVFWNYTFNRYLYLQDPRLEGPSALGTLAASAGEAPLLWIAGLAGIALAIRRPRLETTIAAVVVAGLTTVLFFSRFPFGHNLLLLQPCLALLAIPILDAALASERWRLAATSAMLLMVAKTAVLGAFYTEVPDAPAIQAAALASTSPQDPVAIPPPYNPIFRKDAFYFWVEPGKFVPAYLECCARGPCPEGKASDDARAWTASPPLAVFAPPGEPTWRPWGWAEHRVEYSEGASGLWLRAGPTSIARAARR